MFITTTRQLNFIVLVLCILVFSAMVYLQFFMGIQPCPLCIMQRIALLATIVFLLAAFMQNPQKTGQRIYYLLMMISTSFGALTALRQIWLQYVTPPALDICGPGLNYMVTTLPISETIKQVFLGSGDCSLIDFTLFHLSLSVWSFALFSLLIVFALYQIITCTTKKFDRKNTD